MGLTGETAPEELRALLPLVAEGRLAALGPHNARDLADEGVASIRDRVHLRSDMEVVQMGGHAAVEEAIALLDDRPWWFHVDLDVLAEREFDAQDFPEPDGITWHTLTELSSMALAHPGCRGWSLVIYNPDRDPERGAARRIVEYVRHATSSNR